MAALSWEEIVERGKQHNKTVICEVGKQGKCRLFKIKCNICGYETFLRTNKFLSCAKCANANTKKSNTEEFINKSMLVHEDKYDYSLVEYINSVTKVKIICNRCNTIFEQRPHDHLNGNNCPKCVIQSRKSNKEEFILRADMKHLGKYDYSLVEYINSKTKVKILCNRCNTIFEQRPHVHLYNRGCPKCNESKGELRVAKYLSEKNIKYTRNKIFKTLKYKLYLKPDFYLDDLNLLIEYDGEYHYKAIIGSTLEEKQKRFENCQRRDKIKNEWAKANNIPLLRIPYWDFDRIEELVEAFILKHTKQKEIKQLILEM